MTTLYVENPDQVTMLELVLKENGIPFEIKKWDGAYGIPPPMLVLHGVPLDEMRAYNWAVEIGKYSDVAQK